MNALFALADSGCTFFDAGGGSAGPLAAAQQQPAQAAAAPLKLVELLAPPCAATGGPAGLSTWLYRGHERVLGTFKRRCVGCQSWCCCGCVALGPAGILPVSGWRRAKGTTHALPPRTHHLACAPCLR